MGIQEMGFTAEQLDLIADTLKEEPIRLAGAVSYREYHDNPEVQMVDVISGVLREWWQKGFFGDTPQDKLDECVVPTSPVFDLVVQSIFANWDDNSERITDLIAPARF